MSTLELVLVYKARLLSKEVTHTYVAKLAGVSVTRISYLVRRVQRYPYQNK